MKMINKIEPVSHSYIRIQLDHTYIKNVICDLKPTYYYIIANQVKSYLL